MAVWRNSKNWIAHPDHFEEFPDCGVYIEKFNLPIWNEYRVKFYGDDPIDIPKEWHEAEDIIYAANEEKLLEIVKNKGWDTQWYWLYHNPNKKI